MDGIDLHIHTALSACAEDEMSPQLVLSEAGRRGLKLVAITDHNAIEHALIAAAIGRGRLPGVLPGVELTSREEVHLLAYFEAAGALEAFWGEAGRFLPAGENPARIFGRQVVYDRAGEIRALDRAMRQQALGIGLGDLLALVLKHGGMPVPAHIDKKAFSLPVQLGFIDRQAAWAALEISAAGWTRGRFRLGDRRYGFPVISGSDSHALDDIGLFALRDTAGEISDFRSLRSFFERCR